MQGRGDCGYSPIMLRLRSVGTTAAAATAATTMIRFYQCCTYFMQCWLHMQKSRGEPAEEWGAGNSIQIQFIQFKNKTCKAKYLPYAYVVIVPPQADRNCTPFVERTNDSKYEKNISWYK